MRNAPDVIATELPADIAQLLVSLQQRIEALERENAELRQQVDKGFRETVMDFSNSIMAAIDPDSNFGPLGPDGKPRTGGNSGF